MFNNGSKKKNTKNICKTKCYLQNTTETDLKTFVTYHVRTVSLKDKFNMYTVKQGMILHNYGLMINAVVSE